MSEYQVRRAGTKIEINGYGLVLTCSAYPEQYDVFKDGNKVAYFRLRHGYFYADLLSSGKTIFEAKFDDGRGEFEGHERIGYLTKAVGAIEHYES